MTNKEFIESKYVRIFGGDEAYKPYLLKNNEDSSSTAYDREYVLINVDMALTLIKGKEYLPAQTVLISEQEFQDLMYGGGRKIHIHGTENDDAGKFEAAEEKKMDIAVSRTEAYQLTFRVEFPLSVEPISTEIQTLRMQDIMERYRKRKRKILFPDELVRVLNVLEKQGVIAMDRDAENRRYVYRRIQNEHQKRVGELILRIGDSDKVSSLWQIIMDGELYPQHVIGLQIMALEEYHELLDVVDQSIKDDFQPISDPMVFHMLFLPFRQKVEIALCQLPDRIYRQIKRKLPVFFNRLPDPKGNPISLRNKGFYYRENRIWHNDVVLFSGITDIPNDQEMEEIVYEHFLEAIIDVFSSI